MLPDKSYGGRCFSLLEGTTFCVHRFGVFHIDTNITTFIKQFLGLFPQTQDLTTFINQFLDLISLNTALYLEKVLPYWDISKIGIKQIADYYMPIKAFMFITIINLPLRMFVKTLQSADLYVIRLGEVHHFQWILLIQKITNSYY